MLRGRGAVENGTRQIDVSLFQNELQTSTFRIPWTSLFVIPDLDVRVYLLWY